MNKINTEIYKSSLNKFVTGVVVIGMNNGKEIIGKTVNSFSSLSLNPPLILFSLEKKSSSLSKFKKNKYLSINILSNKQKNISINFSKKNSKWSKNYLEYGFFKTPLIKNCLVSLECSLIKLISKGDHIIFICKVLNSKINSKSKPLIYYNSQYINK